MLQAKRFRRRSTYASDSQDTVRASKTKRRSGHSDASSVVEKLKKKLREVVEERDALNAEVVRLTEEARTLKKRQVGYAVGSSALTTAAGMFAKVAMDEENDHDTQQAVSKANVNPNDAAMESAITIITENMPKAGAAFVRNLHKDLVAERQKSAQACGSTTTAVDAANEACKEKIEQLKTTFDAEKNASFGHCSKLEGLAQALISQVDKINKDILVYYMQNKPASANAAFNSMQSAATLFTAQVADIRKKLSPEN